MIGRTVFKGFRFGLLLQLSVGPVCLLVFGTAGSHGFAPALLVLLAAALVDTLFILIAGTFITALLRNNRIQRALKIFGFLILLLFGLQTIVSAFGRNLLPWVNLFPGVHSGGFFLQGLLVTASNPMTILFWSGVFAAQITQEKFSRNRTLFFGLGCVLSTLAFLSLVALAGSTVHRFLPGQMILILNVLVGLAMIFFAARLLLKKSALE